MLTHLSPRERALYFAAVLACLGICGFVGAQYLKRSPEIVLKPLETSAVSTQDDSRAAVVVHVVGAVKSAGVFELPCNSRVIDAVKRAGGSTENANLEEINLAARLVDGIQVAVPRKGTNDAEKVAEIYKGGGSEVYAVRRSSPTETFHRSNSPATNSVSLNSASQAQFESLPQIGPATARKIIEYRKSSGGFSSIEELMKVNGIGPKKLAAIRKYVRL